MLRELTMQDLEDVAYLMAEFIGDGHWQQFQDKVKELEFNFSESQLEEAIDRFMERRVRMRPAL